MRLYHGSKKIVTMPICDHKNDNSDFGRGFYAAESKELAREWAASDENGGFISIFELDTDGLDIIDLGSNSYDIRSWIALILSNRLIPLSTPEASNKAHRIISDHLPDIFSADIIKGCRADNSNYSSIIAFIEDEISLEDLVKNVQNDDPGDEVLLRTERAISKIEFIESETVDSMYFAKRMMKDGPQHCRSRACKILGEAAAYITGYTPEFSVDRFLHMFVISGLAGRFEACDPCLTYGLSGIELHHKVMEKCGILRSDWPAPGIIDKNTPSYQAGRILALYRQNRSLRFNDIISSIPFSRLESILRDNTDISESETLDIIDKKIAERMPAASRLQARRKRLGLSQKELAAASGVNIRTLQQYETGAKDIKRAAADRVSSLSKALHCSPEELI